MNCLDERKIYILNKIRNILYGYTTLDEVTVLKNIIEYLVVILAEEIEDTDKLDKKIKKLKDDIDLLYKRY